MIGVYDAVRDRMLVLVQFGIPSRTVEVWALPLSGPPIWTAVSPTGLRPPGRNYAAAIYDAVHDRVLLFGGNTSGTDYLNDLWALSLAGAPAWTQITPAGTPPSSRYGHTAIYDPVRDRMLVFGGREGNSYHDDLWELSLAGDPAWTELAAAGTRPLGRAFHTAIYDPGRDRMVGFAGANATSMLDDVWELALSGEVVWNPITPTGAPPASRVFHTAIYAAAGDQMIVFAGLTGPPMNDVWALSLSGQPGWSPISPTGLLPRIRYLHTAIYDPVRQRMLAFGGETQVVPSDNGVWGLSLDPSPAWSQVTPGGGRPGRADHAAILDPVRDRLLVFGGIAYWDAGYPALSGGTWALSLAGFPAWTQLAPQGTPPSARHGHSAIYDPVRDRMLVYGGRNYGQSFGETWALSLADSPSWSQVGPVSGERWGHTAIYDPVRDRMVVFGGHYLHGNFRLGDVIALSLAGPPIWSGLAESGSGPTSRYLHSAVYDPIGDRMVVFGGQDVTYRNDVWVFSFSGNGWTSVSPAGAGPSPRSNHSAIYDPVRQRMIVFGGQDALGNLADAWALSLDNAPAWSAIEPAGTAPFIRTAHSAVQDASRDRMVVFGGWDGTSNAYSDAHALDMGGVVDVGVPIRRYSANRIIRVRPNPASGAMTFDLQLAAPGRSDALLIFNVLGQLVWKEGLRRHAAGDRHVSWDGRALDGRRVPPGVYFVLLSGHMAEPATRFAVVR